MALSKSLTPDLTAFRTMSTRNVYKNRSFQDPDVWKSTRSLLEEHFKVRSTTDLGIEYISCFGDIGDKA